MTCGFILDFFVSVQISTQSPDKNVTDTCSVREKEKKKPGKLSHIVICQVRWCFGSVGGEVRSCVLPVCVRVIESVAVRRRLSPSLSVPSCQFGLSFRHQ